MGPEGGVKWRHEETPSPPFSVCSKRTGTSGAHVLTPRLEPRLTSTRILSSYPSPRRRRWPSSRSSRGQEESTTPGGKTKAVVPRASRRTLGGATGCPGPQPALRVLRLRAPSRPRLRPTPGRTRRLTGFWAAPDNTRETAASIFLMD